MLSMMIVLRRFVDGLAESDFQQLNLSRHLESKPSALAALKLLVKTWMKVRSPDFEDCCLSEAAIRQYQQQIKQELEAANL